MPRRDRQLRQFDTLRIAATVVALLLLFSWPVQAQNNGLEGFLEPYQTIEIAAPEPGLLKNVFVQEGQRVETGAVVAELNNDVLESALRVAQESSRAHGKLESAQAELKLANTLLQKLTDLQGRGLATAQEIERATVEREVAAAQLLAVQEELTIRQLEAVRIEREIAVRQMRSPIAGVVTKQWKDPGEYVSPAEPIVATVVQLDPLIAVFAVPQSALTQVRPEGEVAVAIGDAGRQASGIVHFVSPLIDPRSGTVQVKVRIPNPQGQHHSGERCRLAVAVDSPLPPRQATTTGTPAKQALPILSAPVN